MKSNNYKLLGGALIIVSLITLCYVIYRNSQKRYDSIVFSSKLMLSSLWDSYKRTYWTEGRTLDKQRNNITTSEGQSYTMLRAVWEDDKVTFDKTWEWTQQNLQKKENFLFAWIYGIKPDGSEGILTEQGGQNSATDADTDIAVALLFASQRWSETKYLEQAKQIINDMWNLEIVTVNNTPYMAADDLEKNATDVILINPSYLAPYAYRMFAKVDPSHDWNKIVDSSYEILEISSISLLDKNTSAGLIPDWIIMDKNTGQIKAPVNSNLTTNYSYDALRAPFRLALDWLWFKEPRAQAQLKRLYFLSQEWESKKTLGSVYSHDGQEISETEAPAFYTGALSYFFVVNPKLAEEVYKQKMESLYSSDYQTWKRPLSYYDDNWAWFGLALYNNALTNLFPLQ
jgi:endoglucanase